MKFEDWIKYEDSRQRQTDPLAWIFLAEEASAGQQETGLPSNQEKPHVWTMIVQVFNSRRI